MKRNIITLFAFTVILLLTIQVNLSAAQKAVKKQDTFILLAMHGTPPNDFPKDDAAQFFRLHSQMHSGEANETLKRRYDKLEDKMRNWPRTSQNDPYSAGSQDLGLQLSKVTGYEVIVGFNEFCAPSLDDAFDQTAKKGAQKFIVVTPMMGSGGHHSEVDIPSAIKRAQKKYPEITFYYVWPYKTTNLAQFLNDQIEQFFQEFNEK